MTSRLLETSEYLEKQGLIYDNLLRLAEKKQEVLVKGDIGELDKLVRQEQILIIQAGKLEEGRFRLQQELAGHFKLPVEELTLTRLISLSPPEVGEKLKAQQDRLEEILERLQGCNKLNGQLIENSLEFINFSLDVITRSEDTPVYDDKGKDGGGRKAGAGNLFDRRV